MNRGRMRHETRTYPCRQKGGETENAGTKVRGLRSSPTIPISRGRRPRSVPPNPRSHVPKWDRRLQWAIRIILMSTWVLVLRARAITSFRKGCVRARSWSRWRPLWSAYVHESTASFRSQTYRDTYPVPPFAGFWRDFYSTTIILFGSESGIHRRPRASRVMLRTEEFLAGIG
jgi:hypothetical protein